MSFRQQLVKVYVNHWASLDENGKPCHLVPRDIKEDGPGWIGSRYDAETGSHIHEETANCRATRFTRQRVLDGDIFPATAADAAPFGVAFVDPTRCIDTAKAKAIAGFDGQHGAGAWASLNMTQPAEIESNEPAQNSSPAKTARKTSNATG